MSSSKLPFTFLFVLLLSCTLASYSFNQKVDSLLKCLNKGQSDTDHVSTYNLLAVEFQNINIDTANTFANQALTLAQKIKYSRGEAISYYNLGFVAYYKGDYKAAMDLYTSSAKKHESQSNFSAAARSYNSIGIVYRELGDFSKALDFHMKALKFYEKSKDEVSTAYPMLNIGIIYQEQKMYDHAKEFLFKALKGFTKADNKAQTANAYARIGNYYLAIEDKKLALDYYQKSLALFKEIQSKRGIAVIYNNIAMIYSDRKEYNRAIQSYEDALKLRREIGDANGEAIILNNIGSVYLAMQRLKEAEEYLMASLELAKKIDYKDIIKDNYSNLSEVYMRRGDFKEAYNYYKEYTAVKDTLFNIESQEKISETEARYQNEKKSSEIERLQNEQQLNRKEIQRQNTLKISFGVGFIMMLLLSFYIYRGYKIKQQANVVIERQKEEVENKNKELEEKNQEILDSITYAKRLQDAILPTHKFIKEFIPESFIIYRPKDIIAGDFYWMENLNDTIYIAAADSTGHGVPGAIVSVVCSNALNRAVNEFGIRETGKILDKTRELVVETFEKSESDVKDGMDISLLSIDKLNRKISWSGANNPLFIVRQLNSPTVDSSENQLSTVKPATVELIEIKPDKQPIGKTDNPKSFTTCNLPYVEGTTYYLFTDGFADQFGGPKGKKFMYKQLEKKLIENCHESTSAQFRILSKTFDDWKGQNEQVDDVCLIGIRI